MKSQYFVPGTSIIPTSEATFLANGAAAFKSTVQIIKWKLDNIIKNNKIVEIGFIFIPSFWFGIWPNWNGKYRIEGEEVQGKNNAAGKNWLKNENWWWGGWNWNEYNWA